MRKLFYDEPFYPNSLQLPPVPLCDAGKARSGH
jgi:hypothetical protein